MKEIERWYVGLTDMQAAGLAFLYLFVWFPFTMFFGFFAFGIINGPFIGMILMILSSIYVFYLGQIRKTHISSKLAKEKEKISKNYELTKNNLRQQPSNNKLREKALQAGREYYKSLRNGQLSIYDEQAINNDLAAVAPVTQINNTPIQPNINKSEDNSQSDIIVKLEKLKQLKDKGIITESDFETKKKDLIDRM